VRSDERISVEDAYGAMFEFLSHYFETTRSEEVGTLLGGLSISDDGRPMDEGMWEEWILAVQRATRPR